MSSNESADDTLTQIVTNHLIRAVMKEKTQQMQCQMDVIVDEPRIGESNGPKSVAGTTVEARDAAGGRLGATRRAALSGRQGASRHLSDASRRASTRTMRCAAFLPSRPDNAAQTMTLVRNPG